MTREHAEDSILKILEHEGHKVSKVRTRGTCPQTKIYWDDIEILISHSRILIKLPSIQVRIAMEDLDNSSISTDKRHLHDDDTVTTFLTMEYGHGIDSYVRVPLPDPCDTTMFLEHITL